MKKPQKMFLKKLGRKARLGPKVMAKIRTKRALANQRSVLGEKDDLPLILPNIPLNLKKKNFGNPAIKKISGPSLV